MENNKKALTNQIDYLHKPQGDMYMSGLGDEAEKLNDVIKVLEEQLDNLEKAVKLARAISRR